MANTKKEKAIEQAIATLRIDHIYLKDEFIEDFKKKNNAPVIKGATLTLRRRNPNGNK